MIPSFFSMLESFAPDHSVQYENHQVFADAMSIFCPTLNECRPLDRAAAFKAKLCSFKSDDLALGAFLYPKLRSEVGSNDLHSLGISLLGHNTSRVNGKDFAWGSSTGAFYFPAGSAVNTEEGGCCLSINFDPEKLRQAVQVMLSTTEQKVKDIDFEMPRLMSRSIGRLDLTQAFKGIFLLAGQSAAIPGGISKMGCDDMIYRHLALMFYPAMFGVICAPPDPLDTGLKGRRIDELCDLLKCRLGDPISVTDMERLSGMSARTLQSAFMKRFGVSPIQWLREQRLDLAHQNLLHANWDATVIKVALSSGFVSPSKFSMYYKQRFGESPSATLAKVLA